MATETHLPMTGSLNLIIAKMVEIGRCMRPELSEKYRYSKYPSRIGACKKSDGSSDTKQRTYMGATAGSYR